jgi:hypothetical protein
VPRPRDSRPPRQKVAERFLMPLGSPNLDHQFPREAAVTATMLLLAEVGLVEGGSSALVALRQAFRFS